VQAARHHRLAASRLHAKHEPRPVPAHELREHIDGFTHPRCGRWSTCTAVPTVVSSPVRRGMTSGTHVSSSTKIRCGVASTGKGDVQCALTVSASPTGHAFCSDIPISKRSFMTSRRHQRHSVPRPRSQSPSCSTSFEIGRPAFEERRDAFLKVPRGPQRRDHVVLGDSLMSDRTVHHLLERELERPQAQRRLLLRRGVVPGDAARQTASRTGGDHNTRLSLRRSRSRPKNPRQAKKKRG
jgi:hypothetical protein